jgi:outer membrane receptor protein involved in Fe transport
VLYPDIGEPYRSIFTKIIEGIEQLARGKVAGFAVGTANIGPELATELRKRDLRASSANFRHNHFNLSFAPRGTARDEGGAYVQDTVFFSEHVRWIVGARADRFDVLKKVVFSPRTALLIKPRANQTFRASINRAFRAPSLVNTFLDTGFVNRVDLGAAGVFAFPTVAVGNEQLQEERLTAYEAGYIGGFGRTTLGAAVYVSRTNNMIQFTQTRAYASGDPPPGWPLPVALLDQLNAAGRGLPRLRAMMSSANSR